MRDPAIARALNAMHSDVRSKWTVAELARIAGMSRSTFAARFVEGLGCAPIEYLARWRMAKAVGASIPAIGPHCCRLKFGPIADRLLLG